MHDTFTDYARCKQNALEYIRTWITTPLAFTGGLARMERRQQLRHYINFKVDKASSPAGLYGVESPLWLEVAGAIDAWLDPIPAPALADELAIVQHVLRRGL